MKLRPGARTMEMISGKLSICMLNTKALWAIVRSTNALTEQFANELTWAKEELKRRGEMPTNAD